MQSKLLGFLGLVIGIVVLLLFLYGGTSLIAHIFDVEDEGNRRLIRWGLIALVLIVGAVIRRKAPAPK